MCLVILSYLTFVLIPLGLLLSIPAYIIAKNEILKFHILQMGVLAMTFYLLSIIFFGSGIIFLHILVFIPYIFTFIIFIIVEIICLLMNKKIKLPLFGEIAENLLKGNI